MEVQLKTILSEQFKSSMHALRWHKQLKASVAWKLLPVDKKITEAFESYDKMRIDICKKYAKKDENGEPKTIPLGPNGLSQFEFEPANGKKLEKELADLMEEKLELPNPVVKIEDLGDIDLSLGDLSNLSGIMLTAG